MEIITRFLDPTSPVTWLIGIGLLALLWSRRKVKKESKNHREADQDRVFVFDRMKGFREKVGNSFSGNVDYESGAFLEKEDAAMKLYFGRPRKNPESMASRRTTTVFITRTNDAAPLNHTRPDYAPDAVTKDEFDSYQGMAVEIAHNKGIMDASKRRPGEFLIMFAGFGAMALGIIGWALVLILPLTPLVEKSSQP